MSNDLRSWFVTFPNGMIPLVEIGDNTSEVASEDSIRRQTSEDTIGREHLLPKNKSHLLRKTSKDICLGRKTIFQKTYVSSDERINVTFFRITVYIR
ncbi:hypothetical protein E3N88_32133 [Mikania micrantha]|uniref:Uncharacterized protein n=1 Tax=Mikania micrantha TaxID=192012 RepID=A0A5N6M7N1_9ASTR|nr:hypothetical protein E3N88_32133 [Mikania micrantha]